MGEGVLLQVLVGLVTDRDDDLGVSRGDVGLGGDDVGGKRPPLAVVDHVGGVQLDAGRASLLFLAHLWSLLSVCCSQLLCSTLHVFPWIVKRATHCWGSVSWHKDPGLPDAYARWGAELETCAPRLLPQRE